MDLTLNEYGAWEVTLSDGSALILREARAGGLEVAARDGRLVVRPNVSNEVVIQVEPHFRKTPDPAEAWAEGCREGLSTNPGWDEQTLARNPYKKG